MDKFESITDSVERMTARLEQLMASDEQLRAMKPLPEVNEAARAEGLTFAERVDTILSGYADREALGMRDYNIVSRADGRKEKEYLPAFATITYAQVRDRVRAIANAWRHEPSVALARDEFVAIIGFSSTDFFCLDLATAYAQTVSVPLQSATSGGDLNDIFANINPGALAATIDDLVTAAKHTVMHGGIRTLIAFDCDERDDNDKQQLEQARDILREGGVSTRLVTFDELVALGQKHEWSFMPAHPDGEERLSYILHSSGSTGKPKGAMSSDRMITEYWIGATEEKTPSVGVNFAPLNHGLGKFCLVRMLRKGSVCYSTLKSDMSTLFEDIRIARPTSLTFFPRVFELIYQHYQNEVSLLKASGIEEAAAEQRVMEDMRYSFLGDRFVSGTFGSAPTAPKVRKFIEDCFLVHLVEGYGNTEAGHGAVAHDGYIQKGNILDYKLVDVPELGYYTSDKPNPRGELLFKGRFQIKGYYNDPEATAGLLDEEGFIKTGDVVELIGPDRIQVIDRRKDVIKLSQAEYVAVGPLGTVFESGSAVIKQIFIDGSSLRSYLLAVVVPDQEAVVQALGDSYSEEQLKRLIRDEMQRVAAEKELKSFEVPRDFIIEHEAFSQENGLLSSVRKRLRPALKRKYGERMEAIYEVHDQQQKQAYDSLKDPNSGLSIQEKMTRLVEITLGVENAEKLLDKTFNELGGDSLGAVAFSTDIEQIFGVKLPADSILSPTGCMKKWVEAIEVQLSGEGAQVSFEEVHGSGATEVHGSDLIVSNFIDEKILQQAKSAKPVVDDERVVLITGANGFLGRQVCLQWMERLAPVGGKVICLIRARDNDSARQRLDAVFTGGSPELESDYKALAANHLEVLAGDVGAYNLGLADDVFQRVAEETDRVCHVAALVNHRLGYEHLFGPNVVGTAEIIKLAITAKLKTIDFVSTVGALSLLDPSSGDIENALPLPSLPIGDDRYAQGYAASKWAGEHLLRSLQGEYGVPINILRGNMMLAHQRYRGQINDTDMFTRLLYSVIATGLAPVSFYARAEDGSVQTAHYDGSPADIVAASVVAAANFKHRDFRAFNMINFHDDDGCSLDSFVDAVESAGYAVSRVEDHADWAARFVEKLNNLTEEQKQRSAKDVMGAFENQQQPRAVKGAAISRNYQTLVETLSTGPELPHLDEAFIHKCLDDMKALGMIDDSGIL